MTSFPHSFRPGIPNLNRKVKLSAAAEFATCNLEIDKSMVTPPNGVYISYCVVDGYHYPSVTNVGVKPTIGGHQLKNIETHLFDFNGDLYDQKIRVEFIRKIREEEKFDSLEALSTQIDKDCIAGHVYHQEHDRDRKSVV